jgi:hypothetical protein
MEPSTDWVTSRIGGALDFDGVNDYVSLSYPVGALTGDSVTISAWIKPAEGLDPQIVYPILTQYKWSSVGSDGGVGYYLSLYGYKPELYLNNYCYVTSDSAISTDWNWLVGTYDGQTIKIYVNGQLKASQSSTGHSGIYTGAYIGFSGPFSWQKYFRGQINDVWVFACPWGPATDCYPTCDPNYLDWIAMGKPECWCYSLSDKTRYQCDGDVDGQTETALKYRIYNNDLSLVVGNWKKKITDTGWNYCADIDHQAETALKYRVYNTDLAKVVKNWKKKDADLPGNCPRCGQAAAKGQAAALDIDALVKWLEEVWQDPDIRKVLDEKTWQKFVESLKEDK